MQSRFGGVDGLFHSIRFVTAEIVHDDDIAGPQGANQLLFDVGAETFAVNWTIKDNRRDELIPPQGCDECHGSPMSIRGITAEPLAFLAPASQRRHVRFYPGLVKKHQTARIKAALYGFPAVPPPGDIGTNLLKGEQCFF